MTQKEKAEAYDMAIEGIQEILSTEQDSIKMSRLKLRLQGIFPELAESEDEKIRKWIIDDIKYNMDNEPLNSSEYKKQGEKAIAWLEKQGKQNSPQTNERAWLYLVSDVLTWKDGIGQYLDNPRVQELAKRLCGEYAQKLYNPSVLSNQESADKVKPKFKVGDWVVNKFGQIWHIDSFDKKNYQVSNNIGELSYFSISNQDAMRLWTIADAKPGDVLVLSYASKNYIIIYRGLYEKRFQTMMSVFCSYSVEEDIYDDETDYFHAINTGEVIKPATREQRVLLFQKMIEVKADKK